MVWKSIPEEGMFEQRHSGNVCQVSEQMDEMGALNPWPVSKPLPSTTAANYQDFSVLRGVGSHFTLIMRLTVLLGAKRVYVTTAPPLREGSHRDSVGGHIQSAQSRHQEGSCYWEALHCLP